MPTAFDRLIPANDYNPLQNLLQFSGELDSTVESAGGIIRGYLDSLLQGVVQVIKDLTGLDLTEIAAAIESIDFSSPQAFATSLITALFEIGGFVITLLESPDFYTGLLDKIGQDIGIDFSSPEAFVNSIITALDNLVGIDLIAMSQGDPQAIIDAILSVFGFPAGGIPGDLTQVFTDLMTLLGNPLGVGVGAVDPLAWATTFINDILTPTGLLGGASSITALVDAILGSAGFPPGSGSVPNVEQYFTDLQTLLKFPAGMAHGTIDPVAWATAFITDILTPTGLIGGASELTVLLGMLGLPDTPALASYLTALPPWAIPIIPASHVRNLNPELLLNPGFDTAASIANTGPTVTWDGTTGHTAAGSAKITAQGTSAADTLSNPIGVTPGEKFNPSVWTKWAGLSTSGSSPAPIRLDIAQYFKGALVSVVAAASITSPGASSGWVQLQAPYTVPAGVDTIYHRPTIDHTATGGTVWFDDGSMVKAGALTAGTGLTDAFDATLTQLFGSNNLGAAILAGIVPTLDGSKILGGTLALSLIPQLPPALINGILDIAQIPTNLLGAGNIADLQKTWDAVAGAAAGLGTLGAIGTRLTNLNTAGLFNAAQLFNIGNIPALNQSSITGLPAALANLLSVATWQTFLDNATHGLGGPTSGNTIATYVAALGAIPRANVAGLTGFLTNLSSSGLLSSPAAVSGLSGYLANLSSAGLLNGPGAVAGLTGYLTNLSTSGVLNGPAAVNGLSGYLNNLSTSGVLALTGLAAGALPAGITSTIPQIASLAGYLTNLSSAGLLSGPAAVTGLSGYLSNLTSAGLMAASAISGVLGVPQIPALPATIITSGIFGVTQVPPLPANKIVSGVFGTGLIPALDASKITSGILGLAQIPTTQLGLGNIGDLQNINDQITNALIGAGSQFSGATIPQARGSMDSIFGNLIANTNTLQALKSQLAAQQVPGSSSVSVDFSNYPDGAIPSNLFTVTYSGPGGSTIGIKNGNAGWATQVNNGNRTAYVVYNVAPTNTDYQIVRGSMASAPAGASSGGQPMIYAIGRVDNPANPRYYVWARAYCVGFLTYQADIGCTINGVDTIWFSNIPLTWSLDISVMLGVSGNPRRYQAYSGTKLILDKTEPGTASQLGSGFRYWGCRTEIKTGSFGTADPGSIASTSVSDGS